MNSSGFDAERFVQTRLKPIAGRLTVLGIVLIALLIAALTGVFSVPADSRAVVKRFGGVARIEPPGLHFKWPFGVERAIIVPTERVLKEEFGFRTVSPGERTTYEKTETIRERESLMLTGDLNVIDVEWVVQYRIIDPDKWLHQARDPVETIRDVSEAVMRRIVGNRLGSEALTVARAEIADRVRDEMQHILDDNRENAPGGDFDMGVHISTVEMQDVTPPEAVKPSFNDVNKARQERQRLINQAEKERNQIIPRARGEAEQTVAEAEAYKAERVNAAMGEASRFSAILTEYAKAKEVTRRRLYLEMIDDVMPRLGRLFVVEGAQQAPLPLLDLSELGAAARKGTN